MPPPALLLSGWSGATPARHNRTRCGAPADPVARAPPQPQHGLRGIRLPTLSSRSDQRTVPDPSTPMYCIRTFGHVSVSKYVDAIRRPSTAAEIGDPVRLFIETAGTANISRHASTGLPDFADAIPAAAHPRLRGHAVAPRGLSRWITRFALLPKGGRSTTLPYSNDLGTPHAARGRARSSPRRLIAEWPHREMLDEFP